MAHVADPDQIREMSQRFRRRPLSGEWMAGNEPTLEASAVFGRAFVHSVPREMSQRLRRRPLSGELSCIGSKSRSCSCADSQTRPDQTRSDQAKGLTDRQLRRHANVHGSRQTYARTDRPEQTRHDQTRPHLLTQDDLPNSCKYVLKLVFFRVSGSFAFRLRHKKCPQTHIFSGLRPMSKMRGCTWDGIGSKAIEPQTRKIMGFKPNLLKFIVV